MTAHPCYCVRAGTPSPCTSQAGHYWRPVCQSHGAAQWLHVVVSLQQLSLIRRVCRCSTMRHQTCHSSSRGTCPCSSWWQQLLQHWPPPPNKTCLEQRACSRAHCGGCRFLSRCLTPRASSHGAWLWACSCLLRECRPCMALPCSRCTLCHAGLVCHHMLMARLLMSSFVSTSVPCAWIAMPEGLSRFLFSQEHVSPVEFAHICTHAHMCAHIQYAHITCTYLCT